MRNWLMLACAVVVAAVLGLVHGRSSEEGVTLAHAPAPAALPAPPSGSASGTKPRVPLRSREGFVGSAACAPCHRAQSEAYLGSHHAQALLTPSPELARTRFDRAHFDSKLGGTTRFFVRDGQPFVSTPVRDGKTATLPVMYTSGVWPLEQYVVATEHGKLQSLGVAWDTRSADAGGAKWFHVYGGRGIAPDDTLFFTAPAQNWNNVCADCHSTRVERRYDAASDSFDTRWAELSVGCEACHGPGAEHVRSAQSGNAAPFAVQLTRSAPWLPSTTGSPIPRHQNGVEVEVCAPCHSRRTPIQERFVASDPFLDSFEPDLLRPGRYHADGQVEGEVYEWASFLQSRMYRSGVKCSDCHEPHSARLYATGNALCVRCHEAKHFDVPAHSHHSTGKAPRCIDCHMPPATFMQIDERRDHSIRIPRPDLSVEFGTPNACNGCHQKQPALWARNAVEQWFPDSAKRPHFASALARDRRGTLDAANALRQLAADGTAPTIARATALERLGSYSSDKTRRALRDALADSEPLLVYGAALGVAQLPPAQRLRLLTPVLDHPLRAVRSAAGRALANAPLAELPAPTRAALERAFLELEQGFELNAARPEIRVEQSAFELARGNLSAAEAALRGALRLDPCSVEAQLNLADLARQRHDEAAAERAIRAALRCNPQNAAAHHALGLWQVRAQQMNAARASLEKAVALAPNEPHFSYALALALAGSADRAGAIRVLERAHELRPNDVNALQALAQYLHEAGQGEREAKLRQELEQLSSE